MRQFSKYKPFKFLLKVNFTRPRYNYNLFIYRNYRNVSDVINKPIHINALNYGNNIAVEDKKGTYTYKDLISKSSQISQVLNGLIGEDKNHIASLLPNDISYVVSQWAIWKAGHVAVPLHPSHPSSQLKYYAEDSKSSLVITNKENASKHHSFLAGRKVLVLEDDILVPECDPKDAKELDPKLQDKSSDALIIYTSGTTGPPKGVVLTHGNIRSQVECLLNAWDWSPRDVSLHCLPLNHVHGIVNGLLCPLYCGAKIIMEPDFNASSVWSKLLNSKVEVSSRVNVFMAVPTIYIKLIEDYETNVKATHAKEFLKSFCLENIRLMVSGSAPLPDPIFKKWEEITGHSLLERYGMTEIGMALSNPLKGERKPGFVGNPLPGVRVRLARFSPQRDSYEVICEGNKEGTVVTPGLEKEVGELLVNGPNVFKCYWDKEEATRREFTKDGWFLTGDTAAFIEGSYKILGRTSVDIIKSGGFKISALDVERHLLSHPNIKDVAVVGAPDSVWGEKIVAFIVWDGDTEFSLPELKMWAKERLPYYQVPSEVKILSTPLPRNHMGKVNKKEIKALLTQ